jgi:hypothetical protein
MDFSLFSIVRQGIRSLSPALAQHLRQWTKPDNDAPTLNTAVDLTRSRTELVLENALLRQKMESALGCSARSAQHAEQGAFDKRNLRKCNPKYAESAYARLLATGERQVSSAARFGGLQVRE